MSEQEKKRWAALGKSLSAIGETVAVLKTAGTGPQEELAQQLYGSVYHQVCRFCSKACWCWEEEQAQTLQALKEGCDRLERQGLDGNCFTERFHRRCSRTQQLALVLWYQMILHQQQQQRQQLREEWQFQIGQQLMAMGEQISQMYHNNGDGSRKQRRQLLVGQAYSKKASVSGDSWGVQRLQDGRMVQVLCDGMGCGELAMEQSRLAVSLLQNLLSGGFSVRLSLHLVNSLVAMQYEGMRFSTLDLAVWNLQTEEIELYKFGAAPSFVRQGNRVRGYPGASLPIGMLPRIEGCTMAHPIEAGDMLVMMSDGLYELHGEGFQWERIIGCLPEADPQMMAEYIIAIAMSRRGRQQKNQRQAGVEADAAYEIGDDMTVLVSTLV